MIANFYAQTSMVDAAVQRSGGYRALRSSLQVTDMVPSNCHGRASTSPQATVAPSIPIAAVRRRCITCGTWAPPPVARNEQHEPESVERVRNQ
jgi:hypothetical protein